MNKLLPITAIALMCSTGLALAAEDPSGRPGKVLDKDQCEQTWNAAGPDGSTLSEAKATPYILNFDRVDTSNDRKISQDEWMAGCNKGWVSADARDVTPKHDPAGAGSESKSGDAMKSDKSDKSADDKTNENSY